jgi:hypothetical protein
MLASTVSIETVWGKLCFLDYKKSFFKTDFLIENLSSHNNIKNIIVKAIEKFP